MASANATDAIFFTVAMAATVTVRSESTSIDAMIDETSMAPPNLTHHLQMTNSGVNKTELMHAPEFTEAALVRVYVLTILGVISLIGNLATIWNIRKTKATRRASRHTWSAIHFLILHLSIADLLVTVFCIFGEAAWNYTVEWVAGELACKLVKFLQMFSLYLSTYVLVLIGIDRWIAVKYPMKSLNMAKRCHRLLLSAYFISLILSSPQYYIFTLIRGPFIEDFYQCVTYEFYTAVWQEQFYATFTLIFMFVIPLGILLITYISTFKTISGSEKMFQMNASSSDPNHRVLNNRQKLIHRAKMKSLRISVAIVAAFIVCWTPYYVSMLMFMFMNLDKRLGEDLQSVIFFFGMSNSVVNPLIYGAFQLWPMRNRKSKQINNNNNRSSFTREGSGSLNQKTILTSLAMSADSTRRISRNATYSRIKYQQDIAVHPVAGKVDV